MEEKQEMISYFAHEGMMARMERTNHRLWIVVIILIVCLVGTNLAWILYERQFESYSETTQEVTQDTGTGNGTNNFVGGDYYGETDGQNNNP